MSEVEWNDLCSQFRLWHSPIGELLERTDLGREGVLLDYAYASPYVDAGFIRSIIELIIPIGCVDCTLRREHAVPLCFIGDAGYTVRFQ